MCNTYLERKSYGFGVLSPGKSWTRKVKAKGKGYDMGAFNCTRARQAHHGMCLFIVVIILTEIPTNLPIDPSTKPTYPRKALYSGRCRLHTHTTRIHDSYPIVTRTPRRSLSLKNHGFDPDEAHAIRDTTVALPS